MTRTAVPDTNLTGTVPPHYVQMLFDYVEARGQDAETLLGVPRPAVSGYAGVPVVTWAQLLARAAKAFDDPQLGLHLGQTIALRHLGMLGRVTLACDSLAGALYRLERYHRLICDYAPLDVRERGDYVELAWDSDFGRPGPLVDETGITAIVAFCRQIVDDSQISVEDMDAAPSLVCFMNPEPADIRPYEDYFGCPVLFDQPETRIRVPIAGLLLPLKSRDAELEALMAEQADALLAAMPRLDPVITATRKMIAQSLHEGEPDMAAVAARLETAPRTLQRHLNAAGTRFRQELAAVRRELADAYLRDPRLTIAEIALLLGYSEHSAFSRSYRRWTGRTPQTVRAGSG